MTTQDFIADVLAEDYKFYMDEYKYKEDAVKLAQMLKVAIDFMSWIKLHGEGCDMIECRSCEAKSMLAELDRIAQGEE